MQCICIEQLSQQFNTTNSFAIKKEISLGHFSFLNGSKSVRLEGVCVWLIFTFLHRFSHYFRAVLWLRLSEAWICLYLNHHSPGWLFMVDVRLNGEPPLLAIFCGLQRVSFTTVPFFLPSSALTTLNSSMKPDLFRPLSSILPPELSTSATQELLKISSLFLRNVGSASVSLGGWAFTGRFAADDE